MSVLVLGELDQRVQQPVRRCRNAERRALANDETVEVVDLAGPAAGEVLGGGRTLPGHGDTEIQHGVEDVGGHRHPVGFGDGDAFPNDIRDRRDDALALEQETVGTLRQGREGVVGAVRDQFRPERVDRARREEEGRRGSGKDGDAKEDEGKAKNSCAKEKGKRRR